MSTIRMFEDVSHAKLYAKFRPTYPQKVFDAISLFATKHKIDLEPGLALDIACGSGQSTFSVANCVEKCIGVDISRAQIDCANERKAAEKNDCVEFMVADAHSLPFEDNHFDLVACSQGWHWFDPKVVCPEVSRVLKKPGCLAVYGYGPFVLSHPECDKLYKTFYDRLAAVWHPRNDSIKNHYRDVELPYPVMERHDMGVRTNFKVSELIGFLRSLACYNTLCEKYPGNSFLDDLATALKNVTLGDTAAGNGGVEELSLEASIPTFLLLCIKD